MPFVYFLGKRWCILVTLRNGAGTPEQHMHFVSLYIFARSRTTSRCYIGDFEARCGHDKVSMVVKQYKPVWVRCTLHLNVTLTNGHEYWIIAVMTWPVFVFKQIMGLVIMHFLHNTDMTNGIYIHNILEPGASLWIHSITCWCSDSTRFNTCISNDYFYDMKINAMSLYTRWKFQLTKRNSVG